MRLLWLLSIQLLSDFFHYSFIKSSFHVDITNAVKLSFFYGVLILKTELFKPERDALE